MARVDNVLQMDSPVERSHSGISEECIFLLCIVRCKFVLRAYVINWLQIGLHYDLCVELIMKEMILKSCVKQVWAWQL